MPRAVRAAATLPVLGAFAAASVLAGAAAFTVSQAQCPQPGHYVQHSGYVQLVGGCVDKDDFPQLSPHRPTGARAPQAGEFRQ